MMPCFLRRIIEIFIVNIIISVPFGILTELGKIPASYMVILGLLLFCTAAAAAVNIYMLRSYYCFVKNRFDYFTVNLTAYVIFFAVSMIIYKFCQSEYIPWAIYTVPFFMYRLFECFYIPTIYSMLLVHLIMVVVIFAAPFEMYRVMDVMRTISQNDED